MPRIPNYLEPITRPLTVYAFDPSFGRKLNNYMVVKVPYERLKPGPIGRKIAVIDYDASNDRYYQPVDLNNSAVLIRGGVEPSESDPRFHQQMVYAVASETIRRFEFALGREIKWRRRHGRANGKHAHVLKLLPHAFQQANAYYDPQLRAVLFGYFAASELDPGDNLPGQTIFTCLSHDIIAHEMTHAILDGAREHFSEPTSPDTPAFHEAFADIVALFQHFTMRDAVIDTIDRTGGLIYRPQIAGNAPISAEPVISSELSAQNPLVGLAQQFGEAMGTRKALRSAIGKTPDRTELQHVTEPHLRGAILVAAVFEAYFNIYVKRTRDLLRIAQTGSALDTAGELHPDLANRLCNEAIKAANHILNICIRAIDYCPPVDIQFGEFLRAIVTADRDLVPDDPWGYRAEIINAFRRRGIVPEDVISYSEEALCWSGPLETGKPLPRCVGLKYDVLREDKDDNDAARAFNRTRAKENYVVLWRYAMAHAHALGLHRPRRKSDPRIQVHSYRPIYRIGPDGRLVVDFVVEFLQQKQVSMDGRSQTPKFTFRGGATVIFDHGGRVRYVIHKRIDSANRLARQRDFQAQTSEGSALAVFQPDRLRPANFAATHRGF